MTQCPRRWLHVRIPPNHVIIIIRNTYTAIQPDWLKALTIQSKNGHQNQYMKHAYTRRSNANSKAQANMHTSRKNQCNPDMQYSNTWTMDTSNTKSIIIVIHKNWVLLEGLGEQVGFQLWLKWGVCLCVADGERQIIPGYGTLIGERSLAWVFVFEQRDLQFTCVTGITLIRIKFKEYEFAENSHRVRRHRSPSGILGQHVLSGKTRRRDPFCPRGKDNRNRTDHFQRKGE